MNLLLNLYIKGFCKAVGLGLWNFFFLAPWFCFDIHMNTLTLRSQSCLRGSV